MERRSFIKKTGATVAALMLAPSISRAAKPVVKIGFIGPLTGPNAALGLGARNSADLAVRHANASGNLPYQFQLVVVDDASDPSTGVAVATKLCTVENVAAATTHFNSPVALATIHVFHRYKVPQVMWGTIHPDITNKHNFPEVTRICATSTVEHAELMDFVVKKRGYQRWSVLYDTTSYGMSCFDAAKKALQANGATILSEDGVPVGTQDFRPVLSRIKSLSPGPQAIYYGGVVTEAALLRLQMAELGINDVLFTGVTGFDSDTFNKTAGNAAEGTLIVGKKAIGDDSEFVKEYKKAGYKEYYEASGPFAYDSANLIIAAIVKAGPTDKALLAKTIRGIDFNGVLGPTRFDEFGQTKTGGLTLKISQAGKWVPWDGSDYSRGARALPKK